MQLVLALIAAAAAALLGQPERVRMSITQCTLGQSDMTCISMKLESAHPLVLLPCRSSQLTVRQPNLPSILDETDKMDGNLKEKRLM